MSSTATNPWGAKPGVTKSWAEQAEAEEQEEAEAAAAAAVVGTPASSFPSLKEAAATKTKKKKGTTLSLSEFNRSTILEGGRVQKDPAFEVKGLTTDEMLRLPTGPRERSAEEMEHGRMRGGFRGYERRDDGERRGYGGGFGEEGRRRDFEQMPSRADEVDNWGSGKKSFGTALPMHMESRRDRYGALGGGGGTTRVDEVDDWSAGKKQSFPTRPSGFGSGYRASSDSDRWARGAAGGGGMLPAYNGERERPRLVLDPPKKDGGGVSSEPAKTRPSPFGSARPREEVLAGKGVDWKKADSEIEIKRTSRPTSSHSSRPSSAQSSRGGSPAPPQLVPSELGVKPRPKINPFGAAKPREVLLQEKGMDWRKIDMQLEHRSVSRPETEQELILKEEISLLKKALSKASDGTVDGESTEHSTEDLSLLHDKIIKREKELEELTLELDDKVKFGQKAISEMRLGSSGAGRSAIFSDRPPSRSSISDESRSVDFTERPSSRGSVGQPQEERRGFQTSGEGRGFFGIRDTDRSRSRERW